MKNFSFLLLLSIALLFLVSGCQKSNDIDGKDLRIIKVADNPAMTNATVFEYDSKGLLSKIVASEKYHYYYQIVYDDQARPIQTYKMSTDNLSKDYITDIKYTSTGFSTTRDFYNYAYILNDKNQLVSETYDTSLIKTFNWIGNDSLEVVTTSNGVIRDNHKNRKFGTGNSPYKGIHIALRQLGIIPFEEFGEYETNRVTLKYFDSEDNWNLTLNVAYTFNDQNYPVHAVNTFKSGEGTFIEHVYYEYEAK